jgi:hypothetical protein
MANYKVTDGELTGIADVIRLKGGTSDPLVFPSGFASAIEAIQAGFSAADEGKVVFSGALVPQGSMSIMSNGSYDTTLYSDISVAIPGAVLMSKVLSANGVYDASADNVDGYSQVTVNVSGGGGADLAYLIESFPSEINEPTLTKIRSYVFQSASLTSITFSNVTEIGKSAFAYNGSLSYISLPKCEVLGEQAFPQVGGTSYTFPMCVSVGVRCFQNAHFQYIDLPECTFIGGSAFSGADLRSISIPKITSLNAYAFCYASFLSFIDLPVCTYMGNNAFSSCYNMSSIFVPELVSMGSAAFSYCIRLLSVYAPKLESIPSVAFSGCARLSYARFDVASYIGPYGLYDCRSLETVVLLSDSVCELANSNVFSLSPIAKSSYLGRFGSVYVPSSLVEQYKNANIWSLFSDRITAYVEG